jgi:hypothetical protein
MKKFSFVFLTCICFASFVIANSSVGKPTIYPLTNNVGEIQAFNIQNETGESVALTGFYVSQVYTTTSNCSRISVSGKRIGFYIPDFNLTNGASIPIGQNALYSTIWNLFSRKNATGLPGISQSMLLYVLINYPSNPKKSNTGLQVTDRTTGNTCIPITCNDITLTCNAVNSGDTFIFGMQYK